MGRLPSTLLRAPVRIRNRSEDAWGTGCGYARPDDYNAADPTVHSGDDAQPWRFWYVTCAHVVDAVEAGSAPEDQRTHVEINEESAAGGLTTVAYPTERFWTRHRE